MRPNDTCENVRNIVFEILRRRYPETMPTKVGGNAVVPQCAYAVGLLLRDWIQELRVI